jgi:hypothetical protein
MPSNILVHVIHEVGYELMLVGARITENTIMEIIEDTGELLTISIPYELLPVQLLVNPPGAARLVQLLAKYADRAKAAGLVHREKPAAR